MPRQHWDNTTPNWILILVHILLYYKPATAPQAALLLMSCSPEIWAWEPSKKVHTNCHCGWQCCSFKPRIVHWAIHWSCSWDFSSRFILLKTIIAISRDSTGSARSPLLPEKQSVVRVHIHGNLLFTMYRWACSVAKLACWEQLYSP